MNYLKTINTFKLFKFNQHFVIVQKKNNVQIVNGKNTLFIL